ncbi:MAG: ferritin-like domain-containing protein [Myxococcota bacterium]
MDLGLRRVRRSILASLGLLAACGPSVSLESGDGAGSGDDGAMNEGSTSAPTSTSPSTSPTSDDGPVGSGDEASDDGPVPVDPCPDGTPILQRDVDGSVPTGFELCGDGSIHRVSAVACDDPMPRGDACTLEGQSCEVDADCNAAPHGRCLEMWGQKDLTCGCQYGCESDADCDANEMCACGGEENGYPGQSTCIPTECANDDACGDAMCLLGFGDDGCSLFFAGACATADDECASTNDCSDFANCWPSSEGNWTCEDFCCCGRPLLVAGRPVTAAAVPRDDWTAGPRPDALELSPMLRRRVAEYFVQAGQLEHASVASFARFTLELMSVGAPPELLVAAQQAGLDEIDHAQRCFALASHYGARPLGPGPLATAGAVPAATLEEVVVAVIEEACIGETLAAIEARAALAHATVPAVRETLEVIAADELRHAELGWQTLRWALEVADETLRMRLLARLELAIDKAEHDRPISMVDHDRDALCRHGLLDPAQRREAHTGAIAEVLRPCAGALWEQYAAVAPGDEAPVPTRG